MNIAKLLKYCAKGTKLYSTIWGNVTLCNIFSMGNIAIKISDEHVEELFDDGRYTSKGECILFPSKNQRSWKKFRVPANKGAIMMLPDGSTPFIFKGYWGDKCYCNFYCGIDLTDNLIINHDSYSNWTGKFVIPASEEAKKKLFNKIAEAGYRWNSKTLELEKVKQNELKPFDKVLVRDDLNEKWSVSLFSYYCEKAEDFLYACINGYYDQCIPYEGNEYLLGTNNNPQ